MPNVKGLGYAVAMLLVIVAGLLDWVMWPLIRPTGATLFFAAVVLSAMWGGLGPGLLATFLSVLVLGLFVLRGTGWLILESEVALQLILFVAVAALVTSLNAARRRAEHTLQAAKEAAETTNRANDEFLATLSHELRTPIGAVLLWAKMLRAGQISEDRKQHALDTIVHCAEDQRRMVEHLLETSRLVFGKMQLAQDPVDLAAIVQASIDEVQPSAEAKNLALEATLGRLDAVVLGDATRLEQTVLNLLNNAIKFAPAGGSIDVRLSRQDDRAVLEVIDSGEGISPDFLPHVFDRFRQADSSTTRRHDGLGLGLFLVRSVVEMHGGSVQARSEGKGRGAAFTISLPLVANVAPDAFPQTDAAPSLQGGTIPGC